ncbi:MAG TPA: LPS export ABC transporter periplasmic protein LptC [Gemmatimonadales bacterium]|nr:LPS export ABC transporter periplasmic protein LptC [Gemmatimonadales bacterium]
MKERKTSSKGVERLRRLCLTLLLDAFLLSCKSGTPVTATQAALDSADQVLIGMTHYVTNAGVLRARVRADTAFFFSGTQRAELRNVHVTFYDATGQPTSVLTARAGTQHWRTGDMEARGSVVVVRNKDGGTMRTEVMYYNQLRNEVSSDRDFVFDAPDRHIEGRGFTSDPEFRRITAKGPRGTGGEFVLPSQ